MRRARAAATPTGRRGTATPARRRRGSRRRRSHRCRPGTRGSRAGGQSTRHVRAAERPVQARVRDQRSGHRRPRVGTARARRRLPRPDRAARSPTRPTTASSPPTWSRSKWVSTSRSMRATPTRSRQAVEGCRIGAGVDRARPRPLSARAPRRPGRRRTRARSTAAGSVHRPADGGRARRHRRRHRRRPRARDRAGARASRSRARSRAPSRRSRSRRRRSPRVSAATPGQPSSQASWSPGSALNVCAVPAIQDAGSQAIAVRPDWIHGSGAARHAASPTIVATGAAGAARRFATTPYSGTLGVIMHQERAAGELRGERHRQRESQGTRHRALESRGKRAGEQQQRRRRGRGQREAERSRQPRVGDQEHGDRRARARPCLRRSGPGARRASRCRPSPPARTTLGSGVTSRTKPPAPPRPHPTRARREPPMAATAPKASPTTIAQFAPDTAVRCDSDDSFIAASRSGVTADVSPTASPGIRPAPGAGSPAAEPTSPSAQVRRRQRAAPLRRRGHVHAARGR